MTTIKTTPFDAADYLETAQDIADFLAEAFQDGDAATIAHAIGTAARAKGMTQIAKDAGMSRESLYKALSADGSPQFSTVLKVLHALGVHLSVEPLKERA